MDIFQPKKNATTIVQRGLPKVINQHIAEYWCFKKCDHCKKHYHLNHFKFQYIMRRKRWTNTDECYTCRNVPQLWKIMQKAEFVPSRNSGSARRFVMAVKCPKFMKFYGNEWGSYAFDAVSILEFIDNQGVPLEQMNYQRIVWEVEDAVNEDY